MKHTSIRLSEDHAARIAESGESPTIVIKKALDLYFNIPNPARELMDEHIRLYHSAPPAHKVSTEPRAQSEHTISTEKAQDEHKLSTETRQALSFILSELEAGREPTSREAADKVGLTPTGLGMMLSRVGIKAQNTRREMRSVKIFTKPMKAKIEEILKSD